MSTQFPVKDKTKFKHQHNITYFSKCPEIDCKETYIGETDRRIQERIIDHNNRDKKTYLLKHSQGSQHSHVWINDFKILNSNYKKDIKRNISEALYIRK